VRYYGVQNEVKSYLNRLQSEDGIEVSLGTVKTLNDRVEALKKSGVWSQYGLGFNDGDADRYFQRATVRDAIGRFEVCLFVRGMKTLGLWQNMVSWPMRSYQNVGTGSTVYSLGGLGTFNGSMINSPTWGNNGITFNAAAVSRIETSYPHNPYRPQIYCMIIRRGGVNSTTYGLIGSSGTLMNQLRRDGANRWRGDSIGVSGTIIYYQNTGGNAAFSDNALTYVSLHGVSGAFTGTVDGVTWLAPNNGVAGTPGASNLSIGVAAYNTSPWPSDIVFFSVFESSDFNIANNIRNLTKRILVSDLPVP
jgi:hypothetical protein